MEILLKTGPTAEKLHARLNAWLKSFPEWHDNFVWTPNQTPAWHQPKKPLNQSTVALISTGGIHLKNQPVFEVSAPFGDSSFRVIPSDSDPRDLMISHTHYDHAEADHDINCTFPITHLQSLKQEGVIGHVAPRFYGLNGFIPDPRTLVTETAPTLTEMLLEDGVDVVLLTPGSAICQQTIGLLQDAFEKAGISTISITLKPEVTLFMNVPRAVYIRFPYGYSVGPALQPLLQKDIVRKTLELIDQIQEPGTVVKLPYRWAGVQAVSQIRSAEPRTQALINHIDQMLELLKGIETDMAAAQQEEHQKPTPDQHKSAFYISQAQRAAKLAALLENDAIDQVHGLRNLSGPIFYLRGK